AREFDQRMVQSVVGGTGENNVAHWSERSLARVAPGSSASGLESPWPELSSLAQLWSGVWQPAIAGALVLVVAGGLYVYQQQRTRGHQVSLAASRPAPTEIESRFRVARDRLAASEDLFKDEVFKGADTKPPENRTLPSPQPQPL